MSIDLETRLRHYGHTLDRAAGNSRSVDSRSTSPDEEWEGDVVVINYPVDRSKNRRRGVVAATDLVAAASVAFVFVSAQPHSPTDPATATVASAASLPPPQVVPTTFDYFTLDNAEWPLVDVSVDSDGSSHLRFIDLVGKQAAGSELGGGDLELWTGVAARQVIIDNVDNGVFGSPEPIRIADQPATLYSRESYSHVVVWKTAGGAAAVLKIEGPREVDYRTLIGQVRGLSETDLRALVDQEASKAATETTVVVSCGACTTASTSSPAFDG